MRLLTSSHGNTCAGSTPAPSFVPRWCRPGNTLSRRGGEAVRISKGQNHRIYNDVAQEDKGALKALIKGIVSDDVPYPYRKSDGGNPHKALGNESNKTARLKLIDRSGATSYSLYGQTDRDDVNILINGSIMSLEKSDIKEFIKFLKKLQ